MPLVVNTGIYGGGCDCDFQDYSECWLFWLFCINILSHYSSGCCTRANRDIFGQDCVGVNNIFAVQQTWAYTIHATTWHLAVGRMPYNEFNRHFVLYNMSTDRRVLNMPTMATTKTIVWLTEIVLDNLYALCTNKFSPTQIRTQI